MATHYHLGDFPPQIDWESLIHLIGPANAGLARYDGLLSAIPNASLLLAPLTTQEAVLSSKIEGTQVTMGEVLEIEAEGFSESLATKPKRDDAEEVLNYRKALWICATVVEERPISQQMLRSAHEMLMQGVRGRDKNPGSYRTEQNWIGAKGCSIEEASFVPISQDHLQSGMDLWEWYLQSENEKDGLVQLAVIHAEFEALHPFKDGNGRLGRMLIPLFLFQRGMLTHPNFYMSSFFEANREEYIDRLQAISRNGDWTQWCAFFLKGIRQQAAENETKAREILDLHTRLRMRVSEETHSQHALKVVDCLFDSPVFSIPLFAQRTGITKQTSARIVKQLSESGVLFTVTAGTGRRAGIYVFRELISIVEGRDLFASHQ